MDTFTRREIFTTPRFLDFVGAEELTKQIGHPSRMWALVAVKELIDNAIDHAEEEGLPPQVEVEVTRRTITVADHGRGIPDEAIDGALDFAVRASSREAFVGPTRGAQGNALKTLFMMPHALGGEQDGLITVDTMGVRHGIRLGVDRIAQKPLIKRTREAGVVKTGGLVQIALPDSASWMPAADSGAIYNAAAASIAELLERFALLNPHLAVTGRIDGWPLELSWRPTITDWKRWKPSDPLVAAWYTPDSFERLFCAQLNAERQRGRISFVRDFIGLFRGVSGTAKRKMVLADTGLAGKTLEALVDEDGKPDRSGLELLLYCLQEVGTAPKPNTLGIIGKEHLLERLGLDAKAREQFTYQLVTGTDPSSPTLTELAMTICEDGEDERGRRGRRCAAAALRDQSQPVAVGCSRVRGGEFQRLHADRPWTVARGATGRRHRPIGGGGPPSDRAAAIHQPREVRAQDRRRGRRGDSGCRGQDLGSVAETEREGDPRQACCPEAHGGVRQAATQSDSEESCG